VFAPSVGYVHLSLEFFGNELLNSLNGSLVKSLLVVVCWDVRGIGKVCVLLEAESISGLVHITCFGAVNLFIQPLASQKRLVD
jgi:hypothetical protein